MTLSVNAITAPLVLSSGTAEVKINRYTAPMEDQIHYSMVYGTDFEYDEILEQEVSWIAGGNPYAKWPSRWSWLRKNDAFLHHIGPNTLTTAYDDKVFFTGSRSLRRLASHSTYIADVAPWGLNRAGCASTVQLAVRFKNALTTDQIVCLSGQWDSTLSESHLWGLEENSGNTRFIIQYASPTYDGGGAHLSYTTNTLYSSNINFDPTYWHLYRLAIDTSQGKAFIFVDDILFETITLPSTAGYLNTIPATYYGHSDTYCFIGCAGLAGEYGLDGWIDAVSVYTGVAITDNKLTCSGKGHPIRLKTGTPATGVERDYLALKASSDDTYYSLPINYGDSVEKVSEELLTSCNFVIPSSYPGNGLVNDGYDQGLFDIDQYSSNLIYLPVGDIDKGLEPLAKGGINSSRINSDSGQGFIITDISYAGAFMGGVHAFTLSHDGTQKTRTLFSIGDYDSVNSYSYTIELVYLGSPDFETRVRVAFVNESHSWQELISDDEVPVDTISTVVVSMNYFTKTNPSTQKNSNVEICICINGGTEKKSTLTGPINTNNYTDLSSLTSTASSELVVLGAKADNGSTVTDRSVETQLHMIDLSLTESAEGVTFNYYGYLNELNDATRLDWVDFETFAAGYHTAVSSNPYVDYISNPIPNLINDIRFQGLVGFDYVIDSLQNYDWTAYNSTYSSERQLPITATSMKLSSGVPLDEAGYLECEDTVAMLTEIADGEFFFEMWSAVEPPPGVDDISSSVVWFSLQNTNDNLLPNFFNAKPFLAIEADFNSGRAYQIDCIYMRIYDENGNLVLDEDNPFDADGPVIYPFDKTKFHHIALGREISGSDSIYRLFVNGKIVQEYTHTGAIIDYSAVPLSSMTKMRIGTPWKTLQSVEYSANMFISSFKAWTTHRYSSDFEPEQTDSANSYTECNYVESQVNTFQTGDRWLDGSGTEYEWDGTQWVDINTETPPTGSSKLFHVGRSTALTIPTSDWTAVQPYEELYTLGSPYTYEPLGSLYPGIVRVDEGTYIINFLMQGSGGSDFDIRIASHYSDTITTSPVFEGITGAETTEGGTFPSLLDFSYVARRGELLRVEARENSGGSDIEFLSWQIVRV